VQAGSRCVQALAQEAAFDAADYMPLHAPAVGARTFFKAQMQMSWHSLLHHALWQAPRIKSTVSWSTEQAALRLGQLCFLSTHLQSTLKEERCSNPL